ncbi:hypothetical protein TomTYG45_22590 [Sphingobium sp. TomTYG45]
MAKGKITKRTIDSLVSQDYIGFVWDLDTKGFGAKFTKSGAISYVVQYRMGGREAATRRYTIGRHGSPLGDLTDGHGVENSGYVGSGDLRQRFVLEYGLNMQSEGALDHFCPPLSPH